MKNRFWRLHCRIFGHKLKYNFPLSSMPNKCICQSCHKKWELNLTTLQWEMVDNFKHSLGTDKEIIKRWV